MESLTKRQNKVLQWIVRSFIETASPVSSKHLVKNYPLGCCPATIRNEMVLLEENGFIEQPHTSAGRIPTDKGYRYYVDTLMTRELLLPEEREKIQKSIEKARGDVNQILGEASRILGKISCELSVVLTPWISWGLFDRLEFVELTKKKVLVIIHVQSRLVKTMIMEVETELESKDLSQTASVLNERLSGLTLEEIQNTISDRVRIVSRGNQVLIRNVLNSASRLFDFSEPLDVHTCGTQNIILQPEFSNSNMLEKIFSLIDDRKCLINLFHRKINEIEVVIGGENKNERLKPFTVITGKYHRGKDVGTLGVIGPTRMRYHKILPLVDRLTKTMSYYLG